MVTRAALRPQHVPAMMLDDEGRLVWAVHVKHQVSQNVKSLLVVLDRGQGCGRCG